jgi:hypothetical protein
MAIMDIDITRRNKRPRPLSEEEQAKLKEFVDAIHYSARYALSTTKCTSLNSYMPYNGRRHNIQTLSSCSSLL